MRVEAPMHAARDAAPRQAARDDAPRRTALRFIALVAMSCVALLGGAAARRTLPAGTTVPSDQVPERWSVDIQHAGAVELALLPGIGPSIAARIMESRSADGPFERIEDLERVRGIGPVTIERIRAWATTTPVEPERR